MVSFSSSANIFRTIARSRRSTRRFQADKSIDDSILKDILDSSLSSPSSFNLQPTQIIMVRDTSLKERLAETCMLGPGNQYRTKDAPVLAVFLSDLEVTKRIGRIEKLEKYRRDPNYLNMLPIASSFLAGEGHAALLVKQAATDFLSYQCNKPMPCVEPVQAWSYKNTAILAQTYVLAATSHGLGTCIMEGMDARKVKELLRIPDRYAVPLSIATGYTYLEEGEDSNKQQLPTPRLPMEEVCFDDSFGVPLTFSE